MALALTFMLLKELGGDGFKFLLFSEHGLRGQRSILVFIDDEALDDVSCLACAVHFEIVARGRWPLMVFSSHTKFHNRAFVIGKEYLQNGELLEAFACSLPQFISENPPKVCKEFMEKVARHDDLWTSLQVNFWITQRSDSPIPDKLRVFESCCTVINRAFSVLEGLQEVD